MSAFLRISRNVIEEAHERVAQVKKQYEDGIITEGERKSKIISIWTEVSELFQKNSLNLISEIKDARTQSVFI